MLFAYFLNSFRIIFLSLLMVLLSPVLSAGSVSTAQELRSMCEDVVQFSACVDYLEKRYLVAKAAEPAEGVEKKDTSKSVPAFGSCGPDKGIDTVPLIIALRIAWQEYIHQFPERLGNRAEEEALLAFEAKWPCER